ncbi:MAG: hypothetical protein DMD84_16900 [Candidatus Rokuibacteriota bacterium]|nr:MAG: hypothetical protein DMD84_16900 [Candidatus Rokubacteria bacterium]
MQVNLDLAPAAVVTMRGEAVDEPLVVFLRGKEIRVPEGAAVGVTPRADHRGIGAAPALDAAFLLVGGRADAGRAGNDRGLEVVGQGQDQVHRPRRVRAANEALPPVGREPAERAQGFRKLGGAGHD